LETTSASVDTLNNVQNTRLSNLEIKTGSLATTGSNTFIGTQTITGSLFISANLIVQGTSSLENITASAVSIGTNIVNLNTANPAVRYAGLVIGDSGSVGGSGSFLYDSVQDEMIFIHRGSSTVVTSSVLLMGPQTYDNVGTEIYPTLNIIQKGTGNEHLADSCIFDNGTTICVNSELKVSGISSFSSRICAPNLSIGGASTICGNLLISETTGTTLGLYNNGSLRVCLGMTGNEGEISAYRSDGSKNVYFSSYYDSYLNGPGKFGIGCATPSYPLDVKGTSGNIARITDGTSHMTFYAGSGLNEIATVSPMLLSVNGAEALRINTGKQFIVGATSMAYPNCLGYVAGFMSDFTGQSVLSIARKGQTLASQGMFIGIDSTSSYFWNRDNVAIQLGTNDTTKMTIACTGQTIFACSVCAPQYITTQGSSVSYASGTNYTIWNSEAESCIQDSNNPAAYTRIKTWIADRSGCATIRFTGYIQSGPTYWGYRVTRNGTSSYMCVSYNDCVQSGCSSYVHTYSSYQFNIGPFLPGDCIGLDVASTGGGATPSVGQGQWIYAKEFRVFSSTPNLSAGTSGNVFGEWVGIGTCTPFSNLYINGNNPSLYDATVDNGQDGCGVTLTVRNNSTVTNSFAQLNLQVSGDSGRAVGRIALIRKDSATADMAFVTENGNTKSEKMRITAAGNVIICGDVQTPGLYGKSYAVTSTIGDGISVVDTGIPIPNNSTYLVSFTANPAAAGGVYSWNEVGYLIINSQWNGSTNTNLIKYTALAGSSTSVYPGSISLHPSFLVGGTEYTQTTSYAPSGQIRLKFCGFSNSAGASQAVYLTRIM
jgi:hypothetical protein